jgi:G protein beta subunit-like protein
MSSVLLATAGYDHTIKLWEPRTAACAKTLQFQGSQVNRLVISPDKQSLLAAGNPQVKIYDIRSGNPNATFSYSGHTMNVTAVGLMPQRGGNLIFSASEDKTIKIWDSSSKGFERDIKAKSPITDAVMHPNEGEIVSAHRDGKIRVWDLGTAKCVHEWAPAGQVPVSSISMSQRRKHLVAVTDSGMLFQFDPRNKYELVNKVQAHETYILRTKLSPDDRRVAGRGVAWRGGAWRGWRRLLVAEPLHGGW